MRRFYSILFLSSASIAAVAFWMLDGHDLQFVWIDNVAEVTEDLSTSTRLSITLVVGCLMGAFLTWLVYAFRHDYCSPAPRPRDPVEVD